MDADSAILSNTIARSSEFVIIDEPTAGLAPKLAEQVGRLLDEIARRGTAILLVGQKLTIAFEISRRLYGMGRPSWRSMRQSARNGSKSEGASCSSGARASSSLMIKRIHMRV